MSHLSDMIAKLPKSTPEIWDGIAVSPPHYERLLLAQTHDGPAPRQHNGYTFAGIRVVQNLGVPEGRAIVTLNGKPVGLIDLVTGTVMLRDANGQMAKTEKSDD